VRARLLREDVRLLTLTGTGGTGKTRLAVALAASLLDAFDDGVWFVDLSPITDPSVVTLAISQVLGLRDSDFQSVLDGLKEALRERRLLLVLDNFEQVLDAAVAIAELLAAAPLLKILVTSRAPLHISSEHEFAVAPLELPDRASRSNSELLRRCEAVALFAQRAEAARPDFQVTNANASAVAEVCARLDGLPLAIELAAARIKLLPPQTLLGRLSNRLELLTGGARDRPVRHQTLRATIEWSYGLLDDAERMLFRWLSVFSGGCTLADAEAICAPSGEHVLDGLASLLDKSLLRREETTTGEPRFRMLETVREYALEQLELSGEADAVRHRFADQFIALAQTAERELRAPPSMTHWLDRWDDDLDNLRALIRWALDSNKAETALRICASLYRYLAARGHLNEGQRWLEAALVLDAPVSGPVRAQSLLIAGEVAWLRGDYALAITRCQAALDAYRQLGDDLGVARALQSLGNVLHYQGDYERAAALYRDSLHLYRTLGDALGIAGTVNSLGVLARNRGDLVGARTLGEEALRIHQQRGDSRNVALSLNNLGRVAREQQDWVGARDLSAESLTLFADLGDQWGVAAVLANIGIQAHRRGQLEWAVRLFGASEALREASTGSAYLSVSPAEYAAYEDARDATRVALGESSFAASWRAGRALSLAEAVEEARREEPLPDRSSGSRSPGPLTSREREVAVLIVGGQTNREIAAALMITEWTVESHVRHILSKLGLRSRAQVAAWAVEYGLVASGQVT
jgi:predicted ATPase/DNA-binding CsgD family transcriptional regulator